MTPSIAAAIGLAALFATSCGDDDGRWSAARQRDHLERACAHFLMCRPAAYAEDFGVNNDACIADYRDELEGEKSSITSACFEAYLDYAECTIEDCETEDVDCEDLEAKVTETCQ